MPPIAAVASVDEYIGSCPAAVQPMLEQLRQIILDAIPTAMETIAYKMPGFRVNGHYVLGFAAWKNHIGLYPIPSGPDDFETAVAPYRQAKDTMRLRYDQPLPQALLRRLIALRVAAVEN